MISKVVLAGLGITLFVSAVMWPHSGLQLFNAWICGLLLGLLALLLPAGRWGPWNRVPIVAMGLWLLLSGLILPNWSDITIRCHALSGLLLLLVAAAPDTDQRQSRRARFS
jgi:hypothetical protein